MANKRVNVICTNREKNGVLILGGHVQALGIIRSLARFCIPIYLIDSSRLCITRFSKYCDKFILYDVGQQKHGLVHFLTYIAKSEGIKGWMLLPTTDEQIAVVSQAKAELQEYFAIPLPSWNVVKHAYFKTLTYELASRINIPIPRTIFLEQAGDLEKVRGNVEYPVIIKPSVMHSFYSTFKTKVFVVNTYEQLVEKYNRISTVIKEPLMVQEIIPGSSNELYSYCSLIKNSKVLASCVGNRKRQIPMDFGKASTYVESVDVPEIEQLAIKFLSSLDYYGVSEVEFKRDPRDGQYKLLEINPRTWKWHTLALKGGVNIPYLLYSSIFGSNISDAQKVAAGIKWLDIYPDIYVSIKELIKGNMSLKEYLETIQGNRICSVFNSDDLLPFIMETLLLVYLWKSR